MKKKIRLVIKFLFSSLVRRTRNIFDLAKNDYLVYLARMIHVSTYALRQMYTSYILITYFVDFNHYITQIYSYALHLRFMICIYHTILLFKIKQQLIFLGTLLHPITIKIL